LLFREVLKKNLGLGSWKASREFGEAGAGDGAAVLVGFPILCQSSEAEVARTMSAFVASLEKAVLVP
jgi:hypothetical protein